MSKLDELVREDQASETDEPLGAKTENVALVPDAPVSSARRNLVMAVGLLLAACGSKADKYEGADGVPAVKAVPAAPYVVGKFDRDGNPVVVPATTEEQK